MKWTRMLFFLYVLWVLSACHKAGNTYTPIVATLLSITNDSSGTYDFTYSGDTITGISYNFGDSTGPAGPTYFYLSYAPQSVFLRYYFDTAVSIQYLLTPSKLPLQIWFGNGTNKSLGGDFTYIPGTDRLDSVSFGGLEPVVFHFSYSGENITGIHEFQNIPWNPYSADFRISYSSTPNIFRRSDSLMYIDAYPPTLCASSQDWLQVVFFAETFSANTFNAFSAVENNGYEYQSVVTYTFHENGAIAREKFSDPPTDLTAGKRFHYK